MCSNILFKKSAVKIYYGKKKPKNFQGIFIKESFFWSEYKKEKAMPRKIFIRNDLVVLYGDLEEPDIVAGAFFMLTRYEELFAKLKDDYGRFQAKDSLAYQEGFLDRPVVDEYAEHLYGALAGVYPDIQRQNNLPQVLYTHDLDKITKPRYLAAWTEFKNLLRFRLISLWGIIYHLVNIKNPADTFDWLNKLEKGQGIYFFMDQSEDGYSLDSLPIRKLINKLKAFGYRLGWHPDYLHQKNLKKVPDLLEKIARNHFLYFDVKKTWSELVQAGVQEDYSIGFAETLGFRAGTCRPFQVYSLKEEKVLKLTEYPLTLMDVTLYGYLRLNPSKAWHEVRKYWELIKKYRGIFIVLWHNFSFDEWRWRKFYKKLTNFLNQAK